MIARVTRRRFVAQLRTASRFCGLGIKVTRLRLTLCGFLIKVTCGGFVLPASRVVTNVNCTRRIFLRYVRRVSINFRAKARSTIIILVRLRNGKSSTVL